MRIISNRAFQNTFKLLLTEKKKSVKQVSEYLGISQQAIYGWLSGQKIPSIDNMATLSDFFDVEPMVLIPIVEMGESEKIS